MAELTGPLVVGPRDDRPARMLLTFVLAFVAHGALFFLMPRYIAPERLALVPVDLEVIEPELEALPEPDPDPEPEPKPEPEVVEPEPEPPRPRPRPQTPPPPPPPDQPPPPPPPPAPVDFAEVLTSEGNTGSDFVVPERQAATMGPIRNPRTGMGTGDRSDGQEGGTGTGMGPVVVPLANLSRRPTPPEAVGECLKTEYPRRAQSQGVEAVAVVRARISPSGAIGRIRVRSETVRDLGFGDACRRCLRNRRWSAPLDASGQPVATNITYRCEFRVRY